MNTSNRQRRLLLHEYAAGDAWPLVGLKGDFDHCFGDLAIGDDLDAIQLPEQVAAPVRLPPGCLIRRIDHIEELCWYR